MTTPAPCAAGRVESAAAPYLSPPLSCLLSMTGGKAQPSLYILEMCLVTWNIHLSPPSLAAFWQCAYLSVFFFCLFFFMIPVTEIEECWELCPPCSLGWGMEAEREEGDWDVKIRGPDHQESALISYLTGHCITVASGWTWSMASCAARTINRQS